MLLFRMELEKLNEHQPADMEEKEVDFIYLIFQMKQNVKIQDIITRVGTF